MASASNTPLTTGTSLYRVARWEERFENNRSRDVRNLGWVAIPNNLAADSYCELVEHEDGAAHLGVWLVLVLVASKCSPRGSLVREDGRPHDTRSLARVSRLPEPVVAAALTRLVNIGLVIADPTPRPPQEGAASPQPGAVAAQQGAAPVGGAPQEGAPSPQNAALKGREGEGRREEGLAPAPAVAVAEAPRGDPLLEAIRASAIPPWMGDNALTPGWAEAQRRAYADLDLVAEVKNAASWWLSHPAKTRQRTAVARFLGSTWFPRAAEDLRARRGPAGRRADVPLTDTPEDRARAAKALGCAPDDLVFDTGGYSRKEAP